MTIFFPVLYFTFFESWFWQASIGKLFPGISTTLQQHGYGQSSFWLTLRDREARYNGPDFLPALLRTYRSYDVPTTLKRICPTDRPLGDCFRDYAFDLGTDFLRRRILRNLGLETDVPFGSLVVKWLPLSTRVSALSLALPSSAGGNKGVLRDCKAVVQWDSPAAEKVLWRWTGQAASPWRPLTGTAIREGVELPQPRGYWERFQAWWKGPQPRN